MLQLKWSNAQIQMKFTWSVPRILVVCYATLKDVSTNAIRLIVLVKLDINIESLEDHASLRPTVQKYQDVLARMKSKCLALQTRIVLLVVQNIVTTSASSTHVHVSQDISTINQMANVYPKITARNRLPSKWSKSKLGKMCVLLSYNYRMRHLVEAKFSLFVFLQLIIIFLEL